MGVNGIKWLNFRKRPLVSDQPERHPAFTGIFFKAKVLHFKYYFNPHTFKHLKSTYLQQYQIQKFIISFYMHTFYTDIVMKQLMFFRSGSQTSHSRDDQSFISTVYLRDVQLSCTPTHPEMVQWSFTTPVYSKGEASWLQHITHNSTQRCSEELHRSNSYPAVFTELHHTKRSWRSSVEIFLNYFQWSFFIPNHFKDVQ